ncbi:chlorophyll a/b-binding protein [Vulcanococcus limneticus]|uniref:chlorophyll a/b-binding protein n=1 Tax=Vulcanococcus limneticus TaxID=2170428 RepID=UPI00398BE542
MTSAPTASRNASDSWFQAAATAQIHAEQLKRVELFNGRAAMLGFVIGVLTEAITGQGILHQIGLATLLGPGGGLG